MPRKDTSRIRTLLVRLDLDKPDEAAIYERYAERARDGMGAQWIRNALLNDVECAITQRPPVRVNVIAPRILPSGEAIVDLRYEDVDE